MGLRPWLSAVAPPELVRPIQPCGGCVLLVAPSESVRPIRSCVAVALPGLSIEGSSVPWAYADG